MSDVAAAIGDEFPPRFVTLADGRRLSYLEIGDPEAEPMILCHGLPGSRVMGEYLRIPVERCGARLIAPDRPGIGYSDPLPGRSILDWPDDVAELADALHAERFSVVGISAGNAVRAGLRAAPARAAAACRDHRVGETRPGRLSHLQAKQLDGNHPGLFHQSSRHLFPGHLSGASGQGWIE